MGHHKSSSSNKPATTTENKQVTSTSWVQPQIQGLVNQAIAGAAMPPDLKYVGMDDRTKAVLSQLEQGRNYAVQNGIQNVLTNQYQQNLANSQRMQATGEKMGGYAQSALQQQQQVLGRSEGLVNQSLGYLQQQANMLGSTGELFNKADEANAQSGSYLRESANAAGQAGAYAAKQGAAVAAAQPWTNKQGEAATAATDWLNKQGVAVEAANPILQRQLAANEAATPWLEQQGKTAQLSGKQLDEARALQQEVASGQRDIADMSPEDRAKLISTFYNADLVNQNREEARREMGETVAKGIQGINQQSLNGGNMGSSRAGVAQGVLMAQAAGAEQKNILEYNTAQYNLASQNAGQSITERLSALTGMGNTAGGMIQGAQARQAEANLYGQTAQGYLAQGQGYGQAAQNQLAIGAGYGQTAAGLINQSGAYGATAQNQLNIGAGYGGTSQSYANQGTLYGNIAQGYNQQANNYLTAVNSVTGVANGYGNVATGYQNGATSLINMAGQFGQISQNYASLQQNYFNNANQLNQAGTNQAGMVFNNAQQLQADRIKDLQNQYNVGLIRQQEAQAIADNNYKNQVLHMNPAATKLNTILPIVNSVQNLQGTTVTTGLSQAQAAAQSKGSQIGGLVGTVGGMIAGNYIGGLNNGGTVATLNPTQWQNIGAGAGGYLGSSFA